ncbi:hypothetical protein GF312_20370 [Candidatus Poribacteria bacterium]|nr:hypothetical protein [Candidatus Poribacteria bacterium]
MWLSEIVWRDTIVQTDIIMSAKRLSHKLSQDEVDGGYINQLLSYIIQQNLIDGKAAIEKFKALIEAMPDSGFGKRQRGKYAAIFDKAREVLSSFKNQGDSRTLLELPLEEIIQILGWTAKLMKYEGGKR